jgi:hypothetical protein
VFYFIRVFVILFFIAGHFFVFSQEKSLSCTPCNLSLIQKIIETDSLEFNQVSDFLCTIQKKCIRNSNFNKSCTIALKKLICDAPNVFLMSIAIQKLDEESIIEIIKINMSSEDKKLCENSLRNASFNTQKREIFIAAINQ